MSFEQSLKNGSYGEHAVWNVLIKRPNVKTILDVRDDKNFQSMDIDFLMQTTDLQVVPIEVKTDYQAQETGNIVYELTTSGNIGCFEKTQAWYVAYFVPKTKQVHMINVKALRKFIELNKPKEIRMGDNATGYLIPIANLIKAKVINHTYEGVM